MQIKIDLKIFLFLLIFFLTKQIEIYILFMIFAILHEFGHLIIGILLRFKPQGINLIPMGVSIRFSADCKEYSKSVKILNIKKLLIVIGGPIVNFLIAIFFIFFNIELFEFLREKIIYVNLIIGIFNLIPIYPLDGGRIVRCIVHLRKNLIYSYKYTNMISNFTLIILTAISSIAILYFKNLSILFIIIYLWILLIRENRIYNHKMKLYKLIKDIEKNEEMFEYDIKV